MGEAVILSALEFLAVYDYIFWDFDGVIKESNFVKEQAYYQIFQKYGNEFADRVRIHHLENEGVSRYEKIPLYLQWAGRSSSKKIVERIAQEYSSLTIRAVVESEWVLGVDRFLKQYSNKKSFFLVSATPDHDLLSIVEMLDIKNYFKEINGSSTPKYLAIKYALKKYNIPNSRAVMIGDSRVDFEASSFNGIDFILRAHKFNSTNFNKYKGMRVEDFSK